MSPLVNGFSPFGVFTTLSLPSEPRTSHAQPEPNWVAPAVLNCSTKASKEPKSALILSAILPVAAPPPFGFIECQKKVWFHTWAALLNTPGFLPSDALTISTSDLPSNSLPGSALFRLST